MINLNDFGFEDDEARRNAKKIKKYEEMEEAYLKQIENPNRESRASNETGPNSSQHTFYDFMKPANYENNKLQSSVLYDRDNDRHFDEQEHEMANDENNPNFAQSQSGR